ncbi:MAG: T9SS type A sorting domain-containing protein [Flavobacteriales bacterium]
MWKHVYIPTNHHINRRYSSVIAGQSEDFTVECGNEYAMPWAEFSDNCDDELEITSSVVSEGTCPEVVTYTWTATDNCNNSTTATVVVTIVDTTAPMWYSEGYSETVSCGSEYMVYEPYAYDTCSEVTYDSSMEVVAGDCPANYTEVYTFYAVDACGNAAEPLVISITYVDDAAPMWVSIPNSNEISCDATVPSDAPVAMDNCSEFTVEMTEEIIDGQCPNNYVIVRSWTATDACGNVSEPATVSYYIYDNTAPVITTELSDLNYECPVEIVPAEIAATDNCSDVSIESGVETIWMDECGNGYFMVYYLVSDACGNSTEASYYVNIYDETAPVLSETPENMVLACDEMLPEAPVVTAMDNCNGEVAVEFTEEIVGDMPAEGSIADCNILTPVRAEGNPCNYPYDWAMALFAMPSSHRWYQVSEGSLVQYPDGTIHVEATLVNAVNPANGFYVNVEFANGMDWAAWSTQAFPTGFKADCGGEAANHEDWMYYILQAGDGAELVGFGAYEGSAINLVHAPSNNYFGFQLGDGANNYNADDNGFGGWFTYNGVFLVDGQPIMSGNASGAGDFAFNLDCCPDYQVVRTWTAMDCTGNVVMHSQTISWEGSTDITPDQVTPGLETMEVSKGNIDIVNIYPNPSNMNTQIKVVSNIDNNIAVDVVDVTGRVIAKIYNGQVDAGVVYNFMLNSGELNNGLYQVRMSSSTEVVAKQLQVIK